MVAEVTIATKPWSVKDFPRSGDYVLQIAENKASLYSTFEYFKLHFAVREKAKLGEKTTNCLCSPLGWMVEYNNKSNNNPVTILPPQKRDKDKHSLILF